jgi:hypothetical protein
MATWKKDHASQTQFLNPTEVANCKKDAKDCTTVICANSEAKTFVTCKAANEKIKNEAEKVKCDANIDDCSYELC